MDFKSPRIVSTIQVALVVGCVAVLLIPSSAFGQAGVFDPNFDASVSRPAFTRVRPKVVFDEAHSNVHTAVGRYKAFVDMLKNDGYDVRSNTEPFRPKVLRQADILVIVLPNGGMTSDESDAVSEYVRNGGSLLLVLDHGKGPGSTLAQRFGVEGSDTSPFTQDPSHNEGPIRGRLRFTAENGLLQDHPITRGRNREERITRVLTFQGQSLKGPPQSKSFLRLSNTAFDLLPDGSQKSAAGRSQGLSLRFGSGKVVVMAEAGALSAQLVGPARGEWGMNYPGFDNKQMTLNIMHWLSGLLD